MIFLRHPVTDAPEGLCYGRHEVGWGEGAEAQAKRAIAALPPVSAIFTSPRVRCRRLADLCARETGLAMVEDERLSEYDFGAWEGCNWADIPRAESEPWTENIQHRAPPGGERFIDLIARVREAIAEYPDDALVITHAGPIRAVRMILTGASFETVFAWKVPFCTPVRLVREAA